MDRPRFVLGMLAASAAAVAPHAVRAADVPAATIEDLVRANRVLAHERIVDGFGHVSARHPGDPERYWLSRSMAPELVTAADILTYDLASNALDADGRVEFLERFIHGAIYRARPDVRSIVHAHTPAVLPFSVTTTALRPVFHLGAFLGGGVPVFEIRESGGPETDLLVTTQSLGEALARRLGTASVALMRGHGMVAVAGSIPEAVFRAYYTAENARVQAEAIRLGTPVYLSDGEARTATRTEAGLVARAWEAWVRALPRP